MTEGLSEERLAELETLARGMASRNRRGANVDETLDLIAEVRRLRSVNKVLTTEHLALSDSSKPCPHVVTGDEGTAYCDLAESSVRALRERVAAFESVDPFRYWSHDLGPFCVFCEEFDFDGHKPECPWGGDGQ